MTKIAYIFPGQGSQVVGMAQSLTESPEAKAALDTADGALGGGLLPLMFEGPKEDLMLTANTQPAVLTHSIAAFRALMAAGAPMPDLVAGHSLGEYSALVAAGVLGFEDAVKAVRARGTFMQDAVPAGVGAMAAVLNLDPATINTVLADVSDMEAEAYVAVANYNGPAQTVIAGHKAGVERAMTALKEAGARRVLPLPVSAPFHCALMAPVADQLAGVLADIAFDAPKVPLVTNVDAEATTDAAHMQKLLVDQVTGSVRFTEMVQHMLDAGVTTFVEIGPGKALSGMIKRMDRTVTLLQVDTLDQVASVAAALNG